jgi:hypothetical protein
MKEFGVYLALLMIQSYLEYHKGLDKSEHNSYLAILISKLRR